MDVISNNLGGHQVMHMQGAYEFAIRLSDQHLVEAVAVHQGGGIDG
jgi:hypothetical protein